MWANLRRVFVGASALAMLVACSGSPSPAKSSPSGRQQPSNGRHPDNSSAPVGGSQSPAPVSPSATGPTSVAPPVPGNIGQTVASGTTAPLGPVGLRAAAHFHEVDLTATIADPARVQAQARIPGEISGPALSFRLVLTNHGRASLDVNTNVAVTAHDAAGAPFTALITSTHAVSGALRAGVTTSGRYVFHLPDSMHNPVTIEVTYAATAEVARFVGPIS